MWLGLIFFVVGAVILLQKFDIVPSTTWGWLWPAILIVVGLKGMLSYGSCKTGESCCDSKGKDCCGSGMCSDEKPMMKVKAAPKKKVAKKKK